jgi:hypothetical protein
MRERAARTQGCSRRCRASPGARAIRSASESMSSYGGEATLSVGVPTRSESSKALSRNSEVLGAVEVNVQGGSPCGSRITAEPCQAAVVGKGADSALHSLKPPEKPQA